jgi:hypothetical protein
MLTHEELLRRANARAQRRFAAMVNARAYSDPNSRASRLYTQSERLIDALMGEIAWHDSRAQWDALQLADPEAPDYYAMAVQ